MSDAMPAPRPWETPRKSVGAFLDAVEEIRSYWRPEDKEELWFRGEKRFRDTRLCPQLYRPGEGRALKPIPELLDIETDLFSHFRRCGAQLCDVHPEDDYDWYFIMQHYGAPTRILDWSDGALNGLHFALRNTELAPKEDALVYVLQPYLLLDYIKAQPDYDIAKDKWKVVCEEKTSSEFYEDEWDQVYLPDEDDLWRDKAPLPQVPLLWDTAHIMRRFGAQRSRFMIFGSDPLWVQKAETMDCMKKLAIDAACIPRIRRELRQAGMTESVIFPDLDGLGREVSAIWQERK
jgi:FRG domain